MFSCNCKASQGYGCHQNQDLSCRQDDVGAEQAWLECENSVMGNFWVVTRQDADMQDGFPPPEVFDGASLLMVLTKHLKF